MKLIQLFYGKVIILREKHKRNPAIVVQANKFILGHRMCILAQNYYYKNRDKLKNYQIENEMADESSNEMSDEKSNEVENQKLYENRNAESNETVDENENENSSDSSNDSFLNGVVDTFVYGNSKKSIEKLQIHTSSNESSNLDDPFMMGVPDNVVYGNKNSKISITKKQKIIHNSPQVLKIFFYSGHNSAITKSNQK